MVDNRVGGKLPTKTSIMVNLPLTVKNSEADRQKLVRLAVFFVVGLTRLLDFPESCEFFVGVGAIPYHFGACERVDVVFADDFALAVVLLA